jgi:hypothetical protein
MSTTTAPKRKAAPAAPPAATETPKPGIRKLNIGAVAAKPASTKTAYPVLTDTSGDIAKLAGDILDESAELEALEGSIGAKKGELRSLALAQYFPLHRGKGEIPTSLIARSADGREVTVQFKNSYKVMPDESAVAPILGDERTARFLRQKIGFKIEGDKIPEDALEPIYEGLVALFAEHGAQAALTGTQGIVPTKDFHTLRHTQLTEEENRAFDLACPIQVSVGTKGRGEKAR